MFGLSDLMSGRMLYWVFGLALIGILFAGWKLMYRGAYESASYEVIEREGNFELREYPELKLVITGAKFNQQGNDGSFMRLFRYISGENDAQQKIAMTTPVFMEPEADEQPGQMGFVLPSQVAEDAIPDPSRDDIEIVTRPAGLYAVVRFSGRMRRDVAEAELQKLQEWVAKRGWQISGQPEFAGYDAPWTPGPLRRNEVLVPVIRS